MLPCTTNDELVLKPCGDADFYTGGAAWILLLGLQLPL
jgi:hypothetical protein